jgi:RNA polymerase sigma-70 factor (ECF subfamily)
VRHSVLSIDQEAELLKRVAAGDGEAFAELFTRLAPRVLGFLVHLLRPRSLAEEALQETFLQIWLRAEAYRPEAGSPLAWTLRIARSRGVDILRRETSRRRREETVGQNGPRRLEPVGTARLERSERRRRIREGLGRLSTAQRACLALAYGEDLSHPRIAERLSMPLGSVKSRVRLGMKRLERLWGGERPGQRGPGLG